MSAGAKLRLSPEEYLAIERQAERKSEYLLNPTLIVEVLSAFTEAYARGKKFEHYGRIPSFKQSAKTRWGRGSFVGIFGYVSRRHWLRPPIEDFVNR